MRDSRTIQTSGLILDIQIQTAEHYRHTQLKTGDMALLFEAVRIAVERTMLVIDDVHKTEEAR